LVYSLGKSGNPAKGLYQAGTLKRLFGQRGQSLTDIEIFLKIFFYDFGLAIKKEFC
jgi:hypothetical protein